MNNTHAHIVSLVTNEKFYNYLRAYKSLYANATIYHIHNIEGCISQ